MFPVSAILFSVVDTGAWSLDQLRTWADRLIEGRPRSDLWLLDLSTSRSVQEASSAVRRGLMDAQIMLPDDIGDLLVGLLALRFQRGQLDARQFSAAVGDVLDAYGASRLDVEQWTLLTSHGEEVTGALRSITDDLARVAAACEDRLRQLDSLATSLAR
ncbi:hypothetical protein L6R49_19215 [Myxococcota bacterium]|nr:hypothetical protein [Myxococcota bacterium]